MRDEEEEEKEQAEGEGKKEGRVHKVNHKSM